MVRLTLVDVAIPVASILYRPATGGYAIHSSPEILDGLCFGRGAADVKADSECVCHEVFG